MKPFLVLLTAFAIALLVTKLLGAHYDVALAGRIALAVMLVFTATAHFIFTKGMSMMLPGFVPFKTGIMYLTGIMELAAALGLLFGGTKTLSAWLLIVFFIATLPANIYAASKRVDYQKGNFEGSGLSYLWFRIPLQVLFIAWAYYAAIRP